MAAPRLLDPQHPLHIYRHLLREASYLPPVCRPFVVSRLGSRFRKHKDAESPQRHLQEARHRLRSLRAANAGDTRRMRRILALAFGRIGPRRRELMEILRRHDSPADTAALEAQVRDADAPLKTRPTDWLDKWNQARLLAFARTQAQVKVFHSPRPEVTDKQLQPSLAVPAVGVWGRPLAEKVARTKERKWWIALANRLLPPVTKGEWDLLQALSTGTAGKEWDMPPRRTPVPSDRAAGTNDDWEWERYATEAIRSVDRPQSRKFRALHGNADHSTVGIHSWTPRSWRRLYEGIWQLTATMENSDEQPGKWNIKWGRGNTQPTVASNLHREFFEGVDSTGKLPKRPPSPIRRVETGA